MALNYCMIITIEIGLIVIKIAIITMIIIIVVIVVIIIYTVIIDGCYSALHLPPPKPYGSKAVCLSAVTLVHFDRLPLYYSTV